MRRILKLQPTRFLEIKYCEECSYWKATRFNLGFRLGMKKFIPNKPPKIVGKFIYHDDKKEKIKIPKWCPLPIPPLIPVLGDFPSKTIVTMVAGCDIKRFDPLKVDPKTGAVIPFKKQIRWKSFLGRAWEDARKGKKIEVIISR